MLYLLLLFGVCAKGYCRVLGLRFGCHLLSPCFHACPSSENKAFKIPTIEKEKKKMTSMESKLYQLSVNRHTLEDFRFSCWGIFSQSEYTTPWGKESFLSCWTGLAKIDMCNWLWSQLGSSFHILPEPHHKLAGKTSLSDLIICAELQSNRLTSLALSVLLFPTTICQVLFTNLQTFDYV